MLHKQIKPFNQFFNMKKLEGNEVGAVYETTNYDQFSRVKGNRDLTESHVKYLMRSIAENGWVGPAILVDKAGKQLNGQHRVEACRRLGVPVRFTIETNPVEGVIQITNTGQKNWSLNDSIHRFVKLGNQHYILLSNLMRQFPEISATECRMLCANSFNSSNREVFESGKFIVKDIEVAKEWAKNIMSLKPYFEKGFNRSMFVRALIKIFSKRPEFSFEEFMHKIRLRPGSIYMCGTVDQYLNMIEDIYNYKRKAEDKINLRNI